MFSFLKLSTRVLILLLLYLGNIGNSLAHLPSSSESMLPSGVVRQTSVLEVQGVKGGILDLGVEGREGLCGSGVDGMGYKGDIGAMFWRASVSNDGMSLMENG